MLKEREREREREERGTKEGQKEEGRRGEERPASAAYRMVPIRLVVQPTGAIWSLGAMRFIMSSEKFILATRM